MASLEELRTSLGRSRAVHVGSQPLRDSAKSVVQEYFRTGRAELVRVGCDQGQIEQLDAEMQALLRLANGRNRRQSYVRRVGRARNLGLSLEAERELHLGELSASDLRPTVIESRIIETLEGLVPSAAVSYRQAVQDLAATDRISFRGTANELREALRETLDHLAPDAAVEGQEGFKFERNQTRPTQKQKVRYVLRSRGHSASATRAPEDAASLAEELTASFARSVSQRSSVSAHVGAEREEASRIKMYVDTVLTELLEIH